ncbi:MAG: helix-turn-helix transcriptional regulator [Planctomycetaceae bacterium]
MRRGAAAVRSAPAREPRWTFLTNHAHVMILLAKNPEIVLREVAGLVGITERAVQRIIADLERDGFLVRERVGRRNAYRIRQGKPLRHPIEAHRSIGDLLDIV